MSSAIRRTRHGVYHINYHFVRIPHYRKKVLTGPVYKRLKEIFKGKTAELGFGILVLEIPGNHVHMFVFAPPKWSPAEIVRRFKGRSTLLLMKKYVHLCKAYWGPRATL